MKRTGGATIATAVAWNSLTKNAHAVDHTTHCSAHNGGSCNWAAEIEVEFTEKVGAAPDRKYGGQDSVKSGSVFKGTLKIKRYNCNRGTAVWDTGVPVPTGGYTMNNNIQGTDDSACPAGPWFMGAHQTSASGVPGYNIPMASTGRTEIEVHEPLYSENPNHASAPPPPIDPENPPVDPTVPVTRSTSGCIAFVEFTDWEAFRDFINEGNDGKSHCLDNQKPKQNIPISVKYSCEAPQGNKKPW